MCESAGRGGSYANRSRATLGKGILGDWQRRSGVIAQGKRHGSNGVEFGSEFADFVAKFAKAKFESSYRRPRLIWAPYQQACPSAIRPRTGAAKS